MARRLLQAQAMYKQVFIVGVLCLAPLCLVSEETAVPTLVASSATPTSRSLSAVDSTTSERAVSSRVANSVTLADAVIPVSLPVTPAKSVAVTEYQPLVHKNPRITTLPAQVDTRLWWGLVATQHAAAVFDSWSTLRATGSGWGYERDPLLRPFANSPAIYPIMQVLPTGLDYLSRRMLRSSSHDRLRKFWWIPQTAATVGFVWSGVRNLNVASH